MAFIAVILTVHAVSRQYVQPRYLLNSVDLLAWIAFPPDKIVRRKDSKVTKGDNFAKKKLPGKEFISFENSAPCWECGHTRP